MKKIVLLFAIVVCLFGTLYSADLIFADKDLEIDYPSAPSDPSGDPVVTPDTTKTTLPEYIKYLFNLLIGIGGILAFVIFLYGGTMWLLSAGNPGIIGPAKKKMINGIMGLALLLCSYAIIYAINPDLTVMRLGLDWISNKGPEITTSELGAKMYQEAPMGLLVEDIVAKNISCFDKDKNLINCRTREFIAAPINDIFDRNSHYNYCYKYDKYGNKEELMEYHDRLDCIKELLKAVEEKSGILKEASEELETIVNSKCKCVNCNGPGDCDCKKNNCFCCGSPREEAPPSCSGNPPTPTLYNDPCTLAGREKIDDLRNEIYQIVNGTEKKIEGKDIVDNPDHDSNNLSLIEAQRRFGEMKQELNNDLDDLLEAEELVKFPSYIKRLNLAQYLQKKILEKLEKRDFKNFSAPGYDSVSTYCKVFNCSDTDNGLCDGYELNNDGVLCDLFNLDGDPATFYTNPGYSGAASSVILTIDRSGSMLGQGMQNAKKAVELFADLMEKNPSDATEAGLVSFATFATLDCGLTSDPKKIKSALSGIIAHGGTNMGDALNKSIQELKQNAGAGSNWNIVYLTDGNRTEGPLEEEIKDNIVLEAANAGITIYTIGYGQNVQHDLLKYVAETTEGKYYPAPEKTELENIYKELYATMITKSSDKGYGPSIEKRKQAVDPVLEKVFLEMERGVIPIGECVDEAENFAQKIIDEMDIIDGGLNDEISAGNELAWLPENCKCKNCETKCEEECDDECLKNCKGKDCNCACCTYECAQCSGNVCPFDKIEKQADIIQDADDEIIESGQKIEDLIEAENLTECDPDRWKILNKLLNSRYKMEECVRGFESALKHPRVEINFLSCRTAMNEIERKSGGLVLLGYFENKVSDYPYCYPYTANTDIRAGCKENRDSDDLCVGPAQEYMDNYFCAGFVGPSGDIGGNKEGDEAPVCDGAEIPDPDDDKIAGTICMNYSKILAGPNFRDTYCSDENCHNEYSIGSVKWSCDADGNNCVDMEDDDVWLLSKDCCKHFYQGQNIVGVTYQSIPSEDNRKIIWDCIIK